MGKICWKQKGLGTSDQLLLRFNKVQKNPFISDVLPDQVWWFNIEQFLSYSKF